MTNCYVSCCYWYNRFTTVIQISLHYTIHVHVCVKIIVTSGQSNLTEGCIAAAYVYSIPYTLQWATPSLSKFSLLWWSGPHLIHGSLGPPESPTQRAFESVQPFLQGSELWQTDLATLYVTIGSSTCSTVMQPNNYQNDAVKSTGTEMV